MHPAEDNRARELILGQLDALFASSQFVKSTRRREILSHVVRFALDGRASEISGASIAAAVYGRDADFDSGQDAIVRVEMGRVRSGLEDFYAAAGVDCPVRISIPKGAYVPLFHFAHPPAEVLPEPPAPEPPAPPAPRRRPFLIAAACLLLALSATALWYRFRSLPPEIVRITRMPGRQRQPAVSSDGKQVAFVWDGDLGREDIFVTSIDGGPVRRMTDGPEPNVSPAWSPDGRWIAFLRRTGAATRSVCLVSTGPARTERVVTQVRTAVAGIEWTPDSQNLILADSVEGHPLALFLVSLKDGARRRLTPDASAFQPAISPDARTLAFVSDRERTPLSGIYVMPLDTHFQPSGPPRLLPSTLAANLTMPRWSRDGRYLFYTRAGAGAMRCSLSDGSVIPAPGIPERGGNAQEFAPGRFIYSRNSSHDFIAAVAPSAPGDDTSRTPPVPAFRTVEDDTEPDLSPDGRSIAFISMRSGRSEVWIAAADGSRAKSVPLPSPQPASFLSPRWSPDSASLVFVGRRADGHSRLYVATPGGPARPLVTDNADNLYPFFSRDGRFLWFSSNRDGAFRIWRAPRNGGPAERFTDESAQSADESDDGKSLFYNSRGRIVRLSLADRKTEVVFSDGKCAVVRATPAGLYIQTESGPRGPMVLFQPFNAPDRPTRFIPGAEFRGWSPPAASSSASSLLMAVRHSESHVERCVLR